MVKIKTPKQRAYYPESPNEKENLLCWIPAEAYADMIEHGQLPSSVIEDYPDGLEIEVSKEGFEEFGINLGVAPEDLTATYTEFLEMGAVPESGIVDGAGLERSARDALEFAPVSLEVEMTEGEDPMTALLNLK